jgi:hypothetical protein
MDLDNRVVEKLRSSHTTGRGKDTRKEKSKIEKEIKGERKMRRK